MALVGLPLHVIVIMAGAVLVTVIGVWHTPNGVSCDATENMYRLSIFTSSTKSLYPFKATVRNETALGTCKAVALYGLIRHGTRYPQKKDIQRFKEFFASLSQKLRNIRYGDDDDGGNGAQIGPLLSALRGWENRLHEEDASKLTHHGSREQFCLAKRLAQRYPSLLEEKYCSSTYAFKSTQLSRTIESALSFAHGLFEGRGPLNGYQPITLDVVGTHEDKLLRFFDHCPHYLKMKEEEVFAQEFQHSPHIHQMVARVQAIIDTEQQVWNMTFKDIQSAYKLCISEHVVFGDSIWCQLFSHHDMAVMEYLADLKLYWTKGHGRDINWKSAAPLVADMLEHLKVAQDSVLHAQVRKPRKATFRFAHAETLLPFVAFWGLMNDSQPLRHDNYLEMVDRRFRGSHITPFSANVVCVLYDCGSGAEDGERFRVRLLLNEMGVVPPFCRKPDDYGMCPFSEFDNHFADKTGGQNFSELCDVRAQTHS